MLTLLSLSPSGELHHFDAALQACRGTSQRVLLSAGA